MVRTDKWQVQATIEGEGSGHEAENATREEIAIALGIPEDQIEETDADMGIWLVPLPAATAAKLRRAGWVAFVRKIASGRAVRIEAEMP